MFKTNALLVHKKILMLLIIIGSCFGLFMCSVRGWSPDTGLLIIFLNFLFVTVLGILAGSVAMTKYTEERKMLLCFTKNGNILISKQPIYLLTPVVMAVVYFIYPHISFYGRLSIAFLSGGLFMLGLTGGILSHFTINNKTFLLFGIIPVILSFIFLLDAKPEILFIICFLGLLYLFNVLLALSLIQLNKKIYLIKDINIESSGRLYWFNFILVSIFFSFCVFAVFVINILETLTEFIGKITQWVYYVLSEFTKWFTKDMSGSESLPYDPIAFASSFEMTPTVIVIYVLIALILLIILITIPIFIIRLLRKASFGEGPKKLKLAEYEEEITIEKPEGKKKIRKRRYRKFGYTKEGLAELESTREKVRYLYGFILERFYFNKLQIKTSNTPLEIRQSILQYPNGSSLDDLGFKEFTETYRKVRYGNKSVQITDNIVEIAKRYEKAILNIQSE